jgi:hypothetical protein
VPSKLVEYVAAARPILNLAVTPADTSASFLEGHPVFHAAQDAASALRFLDAAPPVPEDWVAAFLAPYTLDAVARRYEQLLEM